LGADAADFNNDLKPDILVAEMLPKSLARKKTKAVYDSWDKYTSSAKQGYYHQFPRNMLFENQLSHFVDLARMNDCEATDWSWAPLFVDLDQDGYKDLFISNGIGKDLLDRDYLNEMSDQGKLQNIIKNKNSALSDLIDLMPSARVRDLDNDGDLDMIISNVDDQVFILENTSQDDKNNWIGVLLQSDDQNTSAIGAQMIAYHDETSIMIEQLPYKGFQSSMSHKLNIGLGDITKLDSLVIKWPDGSVQYIDNPMINEYQTIEKKSLGTSQVTERTDDKRLIEVLKMDSIEYQATLNHPNDFNRDPLIPYMTPLSEPIFEFLKTDNIGSPSLLIGGIKGGQSIVYHTASGNAVSISNEKKLSYSYVSDFELLDVENDGDIDIYLAHGSRMFTPYSTELHDKILLNDGNDRYTIANQAINFKKPVMSSSVSSGDVNGDGYIDLVVTELMAQNTYGIPGSIYVFLNNQQGGFIQHEQEDLQDIGMLSSSVMMDVNGSGHSDIIVAGEWMSIRIWTFIDNKFKEITEDFQLNETRGLWQKLFLSDIDLDGDKDIIAANMGVNSYFETNHALLVKDIDGNGKVEQVLLEDIDGSFYPVQDFEELFMRVPMIKKKFDKYKDYAAAEMNDIIRVDNNDIRSLDIMHSSIFFNEKDHFRQKVLPRQAQYSSIHAFAVTDVNHDGVNDLLLGGNHYKFKAQYGRQDASRGLLILGEKMEDGYKFGDIYNLNISGEINSILPINQNEYYIGIRNKKIFKYKINLEE